MQVASLQISTPFKMCNYYIQLACFAKDSQSKPPIRSRHSSLVYIKVQSAAPGYYLELVVPTVRMRLIQGVPPSSAPT